GDGVWVAWTTPWFGYQAVGCTRYQNGLWGEPQIITDTMEEVDHIGLSITTDALGRIWIGWREIDWEKMPDTTIHHIKAKYRDGETWSDEILIATHDWNWATGPTLAPDKEGGMWALWVHEPEDAAQLLLKTRHWDGVEWSPVDTVAVAGKYYLCFPSGGFVVDSNNNAWAAWRQAVEPNDTSGDIYYSVNEGYGWSEPAPIDTNPALDRYPDIAVDGAGRIWCVWSSNREGEDKWDYSIWASYATGVGVKEPVTPVTQHPPSLTIDKSVGGEFTFSVSHSNIVRGIVIYDASGRVVRDLTISDNQTIHWDGTDNKDQALSPGVYFARLSPNTSPLKLVLIR
ncbi:MAG: FlgD immunoglobulin-like domain containing protein, partial [candidate division WOR-3 bacterium]|nr:FlgD immunoglobulin-like domain containing protein [candidate division WOR-3 bacterium]